MQQLLHFSQALVKDGLVQLLVGRYQRDAMGGGGYNPEGHSYSCLQLVRKSGLQLIPSQPNEKEACNIHFLCGGLLATHLACLVQEILRKGSLIPVPQPPRIGDVVVNQQAGKKLPQASRQLHANSI